MRIREYIMIVKFLENCQQIGSFSHHKKPTSLNISFGKYKKATLTIEFYGYAVKYYETTCSVSDFDRVTDTTVCLTRYSNLAVVDLVCSQNISIMTRVEIEFVASQTHYLLWLKYCNTNHLASSTSSYEILSLVLCNILTFRYFPCVGITIWFKKDSEH